MNAGRYSSIPVAVLRSKNSGGRLLTVLFCLGDMKLTADGKLKSFLESSTSAPDGWCAVTDSSGLVSVAPCSNSTNQTTWTYNDKTGELAAADGQCLTNVAATPTGLSKAVLGR